MSSIFKYVKGLIFIFIKYKYSLQPYFEPCCDYYGKFKANISSANNFFQNNWKIYIVYLSQSISLVTWSLGT